MSNTLSEKVRKRKSLCGRYTAVFCGHQSKAFVIDNKTGIEYSEEPKERNGSFYAASHGMTAYAAFGAGMDKPNRFFTLSFADFKKGQRITPYSGNTIIKSYSAIFRAPK